MRIEKTDFAGSPHIGVFCVVNDSVAIIPVSAPQNFEDIVKETLEVDIVKTSIADTSLLGILSIANNKQIIVSGIAEKEEIKTLRDHFSEIIVYSGRYMAVGNLVAMNDYGIVRSKYIQMNSAGKPAADAAGKPANLRGDYASADAAGVPEVTIAGSDMVGSGIFVNNNGFLLHRDASESEIKKFERIFKVKGDNCTVNFGDPFVKSGILGNSKGLLVGNRSSGPELGRISEIFL